MVKRPFLLLLREGTLKFKCRTEDVTVVKRKTQEELEKMVERFKKGDQIPTQLEKVLGASEENYREIFNASQDALFIHDPKTGAILDVNQKACEMYKCSRKELINRSVGYFSFGENPYSQEDALSWIHKVSSEGPQTLEWQAKDNENKLFWVEVNLKHCIIRGNDRILAAVLDITERKQTEQQLRKSEEKFRSIFEHMAAACCLDEMVYEDGKPVDYRIIDVNPSYERIIGISKSAAVGALASKLYGTGVAPFLDVYSKVAETGQATSFEAYFAPIDKNLHVIVSSPGIGQFFTVFSDITERKQAEELFRSISANSPVGVYIGQQGKFVYTNLQLQHYTGYSEDELLRMEPLSLIFPEDRETVRNNIIQMLKGKLVVPYEFKIINKNGEIKWALESVASIKYQGKPASIGSCQDITERKQAEQQMLSLQEQLRQSQKMEAIGQLAGGVAHDFNNLLTVISIQSQLALRGLQEGDPLEEKLKDIKQAADKAANLTRQFLAFSRRQILEMKVVNLNNILSDLGKMLHRVIGEHIGFKTVFADDLGLVKVDPGQMEQVLMNLVVNAKDSMPQGGELFIETANAELDEEYTRFHAGMIPGAYVVLSRTDAGEGMSKEVNEQIFDPFFTTKEKGKGSGLGLSTVYGIVKQSGGDVYVYSEVGKGTTFKIYLPQVFEPLEELKKEVPAEKTPLGNKTVLVVEDDDSVRKVAIDILRIQGYTVLEAA